MYVHVGIVCMYVCMFICTYMCVCVYMWICMYICVCWCMSVWRGVFQVELTRGETLVIEYVRRNIFGACMYRCILCIYVGIYADHLGRYIWMYVYTCMYVCTCMYICAYVYMHVQTKRPFSSASSVHTRSCICRHVHSHVCIIYYDIFTHIYSM